MPKIYTVETTLAFLREELEIEPVHAPPTVYQKDGQAVPSEGLNLFPPREAIQILGWRAKREYGMDHHYQKDILSAHKDGGSLHPYFLRSGRRHGLYSLGELVNVHISPRKALANIKAKKEKRERMEQKKKMPRPPTP